MTKKSSNSTLKIVLIILAIVVGAFILLPIFFFLILGVVLSAGESTMPSGNVAIIPIKGVLLTEGDSWDTSVTSSTYLVDLIEEVNADKKVKAIIFEINSPGGSGVASDEIATAIKKIDKPTASYIREVGASGSYWVASATDYIFANKFSTVGSIGVIASYLEFSGLLDDYNVTYQRFVAGDHKDFGSPFREPTTQEEIRYQELLNSLHAIFIQEVADNRNVSYEYIESLADGSIYTGMESVENNLVDAIGGEKEAIRYIEEQIGINAETTYYGRESSIFSLFQGLQTQGFYHIGKGIGNSLVEDEQAGFRT